MYSQDAKDISVRAYLKLRRASALLGISKSTLHRWIGNHPIARRQRDARKATHQALQLIETILSNNPFEKPALISAIIHNALGVSLGASTVRFWMKRRGMTYKKATRLTSTDTVNEKRRTFARDVSPVFDPDRVVSIDESSFYFDMKPSYGYCNRSKRLGGRMRCSLLMAVTNDQVVGWKLVPGSINSIIFAYFMSTLDTKERDVILLDNASIHKTHGCGSNKNDPLSSLHGRRAPRIDIGGSRAKRGSPTVGCPTWSGSIVYWKTTETSSCLLCLRRQGSCPGTSSSTRPA